MTDRNRHDHGVTFYNSKSDIWSNWRDIPQKMEMFITVDMLHVTKVKVIYGAIDVTSKHLKGHSVPRVSDVFSVTQIILLFETQVFQTGFIALCLQLKYYYIFAPKSTVENSKSGAARSAPK